MVKVGVLALQGDFLEHYQMLRMLNGVEPFVLKRAKDVSMVDAIIIPGGESTTIGSLIEAGKLDEALRSFAKENRPILGTCAGAILLAKEVMDRVVGKTEQFKLGLMDIAVLRNAYGRQKDSFITNVSIEDIGEVKAAFIRAPAIIKAYGNAKIIGYLEHPSIGSHGVAARQGNIYAVTFHPEITGDIKLYQYIVQLAKR